MAEFFDNIDPEDADRVDAMARSIYDFKHNRKLILEAYGVESESRLLERIVAGELDEHPAYEAYLSAAMLSQAIDAVREDLKGYLKELA